MGEAIHRGLLPGRVFVIDLASWYRQIGSYEWRGTYEREYFTAAGTGSGGGTWF